jgi:hypothetical protein
MAIPLKNKKQLILMIAGMFVFFLVLVGEDYWQTQQNSKKIAAYNLQLSGVISATKEYTAGHGFGMVLIDINKSNYGDFDEKAKGKEYFFIIKNNQCVLVFPGINQVQKGDSIVVHKETFDVYRDGEKTFDNNPLVLLASIYHNSPYDLFKK